MNQRFSINQNQPGSGAVGVERKGVGVPAVGASVVVVVALAALAVGVRADGVNGNDGLLCSTGVRNPAEKRFPCGRLGDMGGHTASIVGFYKVLRGFDCEGF